jgi:hypothetical protein
VAKYYAFILLLVLIINVAMCQYGDEEITAKQDIQNNLNKYKNLRTRDLILLGTGIVVLSTGIVLALSSDWTTQEDMNGTRATTTDPSGIVAVICIGAGIPITVLGTVFSIIRSKQYKEYRNNNIHIYGGYYPTNRKYYTNLTYNF